MCKGPDVPTDLAVVKEGFVSHCPASTRPNDQTNAWFVKQPGPREVLCKGFMMSNGREVAGAPVPTGYVVTGEVKALVCANSSNASVTTNAWQISVPAPNQVVCKGFQLPRGFVVASETTTPDCPAVRADKNAWVIRTKQ
jgi:hypothetical protein